MPSTQSMSSSAIPSQAHPDHEDHADRARYEGAAPEHVQTSIEDFGGDELGRLVDAIQERYQFAVNRPPVSDLPLDPQARPLGDR